MIDFTEISHQGDTWELFARDLLKQLGFFIESPPDRGPDGGKDMLVSEQLKGNLSKYRFRWLVSCKHNAKSGKSVSETDEPNLLERIRDYKADGFIGVYSTLAASGWNARLASLRQNGDIKDYQIFDHREIENRLITVGYSTLLLRYFPESYKRIRPLHQVYDEYVPLNCRKCGKDLLRALYEEKENYMGVIITQYTFDDASGVRNVQDVYACCKGKCDDALRAKPSKDKFVDGWNDISDLVIPLNYMLYVTTILNILHRKTYKFSDTAFEQMKDVLHALSQKVLRETSQSERERVKELLKFPF